MRNRNVNRHRGLQLEEGRIGQRVAGSKGMIWRDASTESIGQVYDMTVIGADFHDNDDGTGILTIGSGTGDGTGGGGGGFFGGGGGTSVDGMVPFYIPAADTFTVPLYKQALFYHPIEVDGGLIVDGVLQGVD